ncbi:hypothetical protein ACJ41O_003548 [Fusarium nematophilum]
MLRRICVSVTFCSRQFGDGRPNRNFYQQALSGIEIFSLITGIVTITEAIIEAYEEIKTLPGLPQAFHAVGKRLPLVESTLQDAKKGEKDPMDTEGGDLKALRAIMDDCRDKTEELKTIFLELSQSKGKSVFQAYQTLVAPRTSTLSASTISGLFY